MGKQLKTTAGSSKFLLIMSSGWFQGKSLNKNHGGFASNMGVPWGCPAADLHLPEPFLLSSTGKAETHIDGNQRVACRENKVLK